MVTSYLGHFRPVQVTRECKHAANSSRMSTPVKLSVCRYGINCVNVSLCEVMHDLCMYLSTVVHAVIKAICDFSHHLGDIVVLGFATSHSASIEAGEGNVLLI